MARRRPTAVLSSVALHGVAALLVLQIEFEPGGSSTGRLLYAELVRLDDRPADTTSRDPTPRADEPPPLAAAPPATPEPLTVEPPAESTAAVEESSAATDGPSAAETPDATADAADDSVELAPPAPPTPLLSPVVVDAGGPAESNAQSEPVPLAPEPANESLARASTDRNTVEAIPMAPPQQAMLAKRFNDLMGRANKATEPTVWRHEGREYTAVFRPLPAEDSMGIDRLIVEVSTEHGGRRVATELRMKRLAFSSFAQFIDRWDPEVQIHDDMIDGRFHSNTEVNLFRDRKAQPVFRGLVTTAARGIHNTSMGRLDRAATFLAGLETGVPRIFMPQRLRPFEDGAAPPEHTQTILEDSRIVFRADGTYSFGSLDGGAETVVAIGAEPHYIVADDDVALHVRGVVKGRVLVYAPNGIVIEDDLIYSAKPSADPNVGDFLGLVTDRSIAVAGPGVTGPGDLSIHASIFAKQRFAVRNYLSKPSGTLHIFGSVSAGSVTATEPRYATNIEFDRRLEHLRAPGFPQTDRYELEWWDAVWRPVD